jgi:hypothetical protein
LFYSSSKIILAMFVVLFSLPAFACDEWVDPETGQTYISGHPNDCAPQDFDVRDYISKLKSYKKKSVMVTGKITLPRPCPVCPKGAMCKPCATRPVFTFWPLTGIDAIAINIDGNNHHLKGVKNGDTVNLPLIYHGKTSSKFSHTSLFGVFSLAP